ncbi:MAG: SDR family oxidoreductase [Rubripirellula sp.]
MRRRIVWEDLILCLIAGASGFIPLEQMDEESFDRIFGVNVKGSFFAIQRALPLLVPGSSVILTGSSLGDRGLPNSSACAASKAAIRSLARTLSAELIGRGIRVNVVCPGPVDTSLWERVGVPLGHVDELRELVRVANPSQRFAKVEEIAKAFVFLASDDSAYMLGSSMAVDGGELQL